MNLVRSFQPCPFSFQKYSTLFQYVWAASAFKGAFGAHLLQPDVVRHLSNQLSWLEVMHQESHIGGHGNRPVRFRGIILTGWSRYDHFAVLCELLPAAIPSLVISLVAVTRPLAETGKTHLIKSLLR